MFCLLVTQAMLASVTSQRRPSFRAVAILQHISKEMSAAHIQMLVLQSFSGWQFGTQNALDQGPWRSKTQFASQLRPKA